MADGSDNKRDELFSKAVRAGKRTYFFDVKSTRNNDHYLTITESKRRFDDKGTPFYEKHKLFLYKEDFDKFLDSLKESFNKINELNGDTDIATYSADVDFDDLDNDNLKTAAE